MKKWMTWLIVFSVAFTLMGCGGKEKAKEKDQKQSEQKVQAKSKAEKMFNQSAAVKIVQSINSIPGIKDPIAVVYGKNALLAYQLNGKDKQVVKDMISKKLKTDMPNYDFRIDSDPTWYQKVSTLHRDVIDSEGNTIKNLENTFNTLRKK